jgi:long-chain fatty acid transport protein
VGAAGSVAGPAGAAGILRQLGGPAGLGLEGMSRVKGHDWKWGWNAGALLTFDDRFRLGASYRSAIAHDVQGDATFEDAPAFATAGPLGGLGAALNGRFADGAISSKIELPQTVSLAAAYQGEKLDLLADWTWTGWSSIQDLTIKRTSGSVLSTVPLNFQDTWRVGLGGNYRLTPKTRMRLGFAWDKTPVQDSHRTPRLPDDDRTWIAGGVEVKVGKGAFDLGYAHLFVKDASSNLPNQDSPTSAPAGPLVGTYNAKVDILSLQYRISF